jgi:hypothetical protein
MVTKWFLLHEGLTGRADQINRTHLERPVTAESRYESLTGHTTRCAVPASGRPRNLHWEVPKHIFRDRTRSVECDRTRHRVRSMLRVVLRLGFADRTLRFHEGPDTPVTALRCAPRHVRFELTGHPQRVRLPQRPCPVSDSQRESLRNFATFDQICWPSSVSRCAHVLAYFHKHFARVLLALTRSKCMHM